VLRSVDDPGFHPPVAKGGDAAATDGVAVDSFNRMMNHMFRSSFLAASIMGLEPLDNRVRTRLTEVIAELDRALTELRHTALAHLVQANADSDVVAHDGIDGPASTPLRISPTLTPAISTVSAELSRIGE